MKQRIIINENAHELTETVALDVIDVLKKAIEESGKASLVLAGGSTFDEVYSLLPSSKFRDEVNWSKVALFFGDERSVPFDDDRSNYKKVYELFIQKLLSDYNPSIHRIENVDQYERELLEFGHGQIPIFDVVLLGIGSDGHTASLFPGSLKKVMQSEKLIAQVEAELEPFVPRVTMTPRVLNKAKNILVMALGESKKEIVQKVFSTSHEYPVQAIQPENGELTFYFNFPVHQT